MTTEKGRFDHARERTFPVANSGSERSGVVVELDWNQGRGLREACEYWLRSPHPNSLFFVSFCRDAERGRDGLMEAARGGCAWAEELLMQWPRALDGIHRMECAQRRVTVLLGIGNFERWISGLMLDADWIVVNAPDSGREGSVHAVTRHLARLAKANTAISLYDANRMTDYKWQEWVAALEKSGFRGAGAERKEVWEGRFVGRKGTPGPAGGYRGKAIIVGGGIAGASIAASLGRRGWQVELLEEKDGLAMAASGNLAAVYVPMISRDDGIAARLSRACFLHLNREMDLFRRLGISVQQGRCGVLQFPRRWVDADILEHALSQNAVPEGYAQWWSADEVARRFGCLRERVKSGGVFFPEAGWVNPASLCQARLQAAGNVHVRVGARVGAIQRGERDWEVYAPSGQMMGHAGVVVVANGAGVFGRPWARGLQLKRVRGQVTHVDAGAVGVQDWVVCGDGYVIPAVEGVVSVGATYDFTETSGELLASCGVENLARLPALLPGEETTPELNGHFACKGRVGFRTLSADRLPVIGALPDCERIAAGGRLERLGDIPRLDGFFGVLGLGSRGILWSGLVAECLASGIVGEPLPLERELVEAMDPARWILRGLRSRK